MYANLLGQKAYYHLTDEDMGKIIGISRNSYSQKIKSGRFYPKECIAFCKYFNKSFEYLFSTQENIDISKCSTKGSKEVKTNEPHIKENKE